MYSMSARAMLLLTGGSGMESIHELGGGYVRLSKGEGSEAGAVKGER